MDYGDLTHRDVAVITNGVGGNVLAQYNDWDNGDFIEVAGELYRNDYFAFFGTDLTVPAADVTVVMKLDTTQYHL